MLRSMFWHGGTEILVILIVALLFLGPDKLPEAARRSARAFRDIKKQSRVLQQTIEDDEHIGGAIRDLKSALRGDEEPIRPRPIKPKQIEAAVATAAALPGEAAAGDMPRPRSPKPARPSRTTTPPPLPARPKTRGSRCVAADTSATDDAHHHRRQAALSLPPTAGEPDHAVPVTHRRPGCRARRAGEAGAQHDRAVDTGDAGAADAARRGWFDHGAPAVDAPETKHG